MQIRIYLREVILHLPSISVEQGMSLAHILSVEENFSTYDLFDITYKNDKSGMLKKIEWTKKINDEMLKALIDMRFAFYSEKEALKYEFMNL